MIYPVTQQAPVLPIGLEKEIESAINHNTIIYDSYCRGQNIISERLHQLIHDFCRENNEYYTNWTKLTVGQVAYYEHNLKGTLPYGCDQMILIVTTKRFLLGAY